MQKHTLTFDISAMFVKGHFKKPANLRQHRRGAFGRGWTTLCETVVDWPPKLHGHQRKCANCKEIKGKMEGQN